MRIAFYAPLKPPDHPIPSGDRQFARLFLAALRTAGHEVKVVSRFRAFNATGDATRQRQMRARARTIARTLLDGRLALWRPQLWFTYHLYYKAPDWLGPEITRKLAIPYVVAEASSAPKQEQGRWAIGQAEVAAALARADAVIFLNARDRECVVPLLKPGARSLQLSPFLVSEPYRRARARRAQHRAALADLVGLSDEHPWLVVVAMFRAGAKAASYALLAQALARCSERQWRLLIVGDGEAAADIKKLFAPFSPRIAWLGALRPEQLAPIYAASDILVWPGIDEAIGLAVLEAQAAGLPAVVGDAGALRSIVEDSRTGRVVQTGDIVAFADALVGLLDDPAQREAMGAAALQKIARDHDLAAVAARLDPVLEGTLETTGR
jgi:glycosyltransferase involved in cell wall biosynthesis